MEDLLQSITENKERKESYAFEQRLTDGTAKVIRAA